VAQGGLPKGYVPPAPTHPSYGYLTPEELAEIEAQEREQAARAELEAVPEEASPEPVDPEAAAAWVPPPPAEPWVPPPVAQAQTAEPEAEPLLERERAVEPAQEPAPEPAPEPKPEPAPEPEPEQKRVPHGHQLRTAPQSASESSAQWASKESRAESTADTWQGEQGPATTPQEPPGLGRIDGPSRSDPTAAPLAGTSRSGRWAVGDGRQPAPRHTRRASSPRPAGMPCRRPGLGERLARG